MDDALIPVHAGTSKKPGCGRTVEVSLVKYVLWYFVYWGLGSESCIRGV